MKRRFLYEIAVWGWHEKGYRPFALALLVPALALVSSCAGVQVAQQSGASAVKAARWSDPATWPGRKVPKADESVTIAADKTVLLDVSPPALNGLTIMGKLAFADDKDLELTTEWIMLHGELEIGTEAKPHTRKATITLTDTVKGEAMMGMGDRGIMISGGTLNLHGNRTNTWSKLAKTAKAGSASLEVLNASGWRVGDEIVLASTDFDPRQAERRTVSAISGNTLTIDKPLQYMHFGEITFNVDERGEVAMLTRNIKIQASEDAAQSYFGGHVMAMVTSKMFVEGVEFNRMGQHLTLARYPIHWHLNGDGKGQYIKNSAIHDTYSRCVTVHGTNNLRVENNVTYNTVGHCFFLEDGIETGNQYVKNLAIQVKCHPTKPCEPTNLAANGELDYKYEDRTAYRKASWSGKNTLLPSDNTVSAFWITNPDNTFVDNVAAGSDENGFWLSLPEHPQGAFLGTDSSQEHLAAPNADPRIPEQRRPLELRRIHVRPQHRRGQHLRVGRQRVPAQGEPRRPEQQDPGDALRESHHLQEPQWRLLGSRRVVRRQESEDGGQRHRVSRCRPVPSPATRSPRW